MILFRTKYVDFQLKVTNTLIIRDGIEWAQRVNNLIQR